MTRTPATARRTRAAVVAAVVAIPFWALVGSLDPIGRFQAEAPPAPRVAPTAPRPSPLRCERLQTERQQSLVDCVYRVRRGHYAFPPGDYPLRGPGGLVATGDDVARAGI